MKKIKLSYMSNKYLRILLTVLVLGCSQAQKPIYTVNKLNTTGIQEGEAIVVLSETKNFRGYQEGKIVECICRALKKQNRKIGIFSSDEFRKTFFSDPNLPDDYSTKAVLDSILENEEILQHIESHNIHYVVVTKLNLVYKDNKPLDTEIYYQLRVRRETYFSSDVFDIKQKCYSGRIDIAVKADWTYRKIFLPVGVPDAYGLIPIPLSGHEPTYTEACKAFGEEVVKFLIEQETNQ